ncbi:hypothetical protein B7P43_G01047 [Cryptotermes secundus]|uniref:Uncharacterized protein n=3 Tax=Cryptotermes secundus TaxID=105785 RepID=A0A2J7PCM1_9NEOP|nr:hypothetical protein B7P43_G01047 [Cryptotermes secundus]
MWAVLCRLRRMKVECELKAKCCALEVADSEHTVSVYQKLLAGQKQHITTLQDEIHKTREQLLELQHNTELQLVMKQGRVEINTTGLISDFDDAILITCKQIESVNEMIKKAGNQKLAAMHRANNFHQGILIKEWEHKMLRMEIEALQDHLHNLQSIKVTRDIQLFLNRQAEDTEDKTILSLKQELDLLKQSHEKTIQEIQKQLDDLDKKISTQKKENQRLDNKVTDLNIDINEQQLLRDFEFESRQTEAAKQRMTSIVRRSKLAAIIQKQHSEILVLQMELELLRLKTYPTLIT